MGLGNNLLSFGGLAVPSQTVFGSIGDDIDEWISGHSNLQKDAESKHPILNWLVLWNMAFMTFHSLGNVIIPTDELIFFGGFLSKSKLFAGDCDLMGKLGKIGKAWVGTSTKSNKG